MVGELLAPSPSLPAGFGLDLFPENIGNYVRCAGGNLRFRGGIRHRHVGRWLNGSNAPRMDSLAALSCSQKVSMVRLMTERIPVTNTDPSTLSCGWPTSAPSPPTGHAAQYNGVGKGDGTDRLPATMRGILSKSLTVRGFINNDFAAEHYPAFLREVGVGIADGRIRYREDFVDGLERAPEAFIGMLEGRNFGKLILRVDA